MAIPMVFQQHSFRGHSHVRRGNRPIQQGPRIYRGSRVLVWQMLSGRLLGHTWVLGKTSRLTQRVNPRVLVRLGRWYPLVRGLEVLA
jgi:hypothetical protein